MGKSEKKPIIGIIGGICSGKSSAASEFVKLGCGLVDGDKIAHELLNKDEILKKIVDSFGREILDSEGKISRVKLGNIVFADGEKLRLLNNIMHSAVLMRAEELIEEYNGAEEIKAIVLDIPLLLEVGWEKRCDRVIFVECKQAIRADRMQKKGAFNKNQLKIRENFQISLDKKVAVSDNRVDSNSGLLVLAKQVDDIFSDIMNSG